MFSVGDKLFIRTVTFHHVGEVEKIDEKFIKLTKASWVADSGRFSKAIADGSLNEVEEVGSITINIESIVDICTWTHELPVATK